MSTTQNTRTKIRSRGHWKVVVRPIVYIERRVENILELPRILERSKVSLRGWDFPHVDRRADPVIGSNWVEQATEWGMYVEFWRFYQSGQFLHLDGNKEDWVVQSVADAWQPGTRLAAVSTLYRFAEIFEFAARLALTPAGDKTMAVDIELNGLTGRKLWMDAPNRLPFFDDYTAAVPSFSFRGEFTSGDLASKGWELAISPAQELFRRFGWDATIWTIRELLAEFCKGSPS